MEDNVAEASFIDIAPRVNGRRRQIGPPFGRQLKDVSLKVTADGGAPRAPHHKSWFDPARFGASQKEWPNIVQRKKYRQQSLLAAHCARNGRPSAELRT